MQEFRIQNPYNPAQTFLYQVIFNGDAASVTRQTVSSVSTDSMGFYIVGTGWSYDALDNEITFPDNSGKSWIGVDYEFTGENSVIMSGGLGELQVNCPCDPATWGNCVTARTGNCFRCIPDVCHFCSKPGLGPVTPGGDFFGIVINASAVTFEIIGEVKTYVYRRINPNDSTESYVYNINVEEDSTVNLTRTTVQRLETDKNGALILGYNNFTFVSTTDSLYLLSMEGFDWNAVDTDYTGDVSVIAGGGSTIVVNCPCKTLSSGSETGTCEASMMQSCVECVVETGCKECDDPEYSGIVQNPINVGVFICAKSVSFVVN